MTDQRNTSSRVAEHRSNDPTWLLERRRDVFSQDGEDGIIETILDVLPGLNHWCVEIGAWDGLSGSNTRNLIVSRNYSAVLVEANNKRAEALCSNYADNPRVIPLQAMVGFSEKDGLDTLLGATPIPRDFDFLSIDIDGNDYHVWKAMQRYEPKALVIEFNPTVPSAVSFIQSADPAVSQGSSLRALVELGLEKGYELVSVTGVNAFFVRREYFPLFGIADNSIETLQTNLWAMTYLFVGYDGTVFLRGACNIPWLGLKLDESKIQTVPRWFRAPRSTYSIAKQIAFSCYKDPWAFLCSLPRLSFRAIRKIFRSR